MLYRRYVSHISAVYIKTKQTKAFLPCLVSFQLHVVLSQHMQQNSFKRFCRLLSGVRVLIASDTQEVYKRRCEVFTWWIFGICIIWLGLVGFWLGPVPPGRADGILNAGILNTLYLIRIGGLAPQNCRAQIFRPKQHRSTLTHTHTSAYTTESNLPSLIWPWVVEDRLKPDAHPHPHPISTPICSQTAHPPLIVKPLKWLWVVACRVFMGLVTANKTNKISSIIILYLDNLLNNRNLRWSCVKLHVPALRSANRTG